MNPEMNVTTTRCSRANETSRHVKTCHMRHIFMPIDQTIKKQFPSHNNLLNATFQSHPFKMGCCNTNNQCLIVTTINPIWHSHPVHHGTTFKFSLALKSKENIVFAHNCIIIQNTNQACFPCEKIRYFILFAINTHIDRANNSKCSVRYIFKATKQEALKMSLSIFYRINQSQPL